MQFDALKRLFDLIATLRGPQGCPWDREQKFEDVVSDLVEEAHELQWAATHHGEAEVLDELGDVLFLVAFAIAIKSESSADFTLHDIAGHAHDKIYGRHPHVFGDENAATAQESLVHWEKAKARERAARDGTTGALGDIAGNLPPIRHAEKIQERAAAVGFDWSEVRDVVAKIREELGELESAIEGGRRDEIRHEIGDLFFSIVNVARFLNLDPESTLNCSSSRFRRRFELMERFIGEDGLELDGMSLDDMEAYWTRAKKEGPAE
jgi:MazG family protein